MFKKILKTAIILVFCFFILPGCQNIIKPVTDTVDNLTGKVQLEQKKVADKTLATVKCQELCQQTISNDGQDFYKGPCLSNEIIPDWVCDVVNSPRQEVDNNPENQCSAFREGKAHHFVEVDGNCNLIKVY